MFSRVFGPIGALLSIRSRAWLQESVSTASFNIDGRVTNAMPCHFSVADIVVLQRTTPLPDKSNG